jgi:hypothetical protein
VTEAFEELSQGVWESMEWGRHRRLAVVNTKYKCDATQSDNWMFRLLSIRPCFFYAPLEPEKAFQ